MTSADTAASPSTRADALSVARRIAPTLFATTLFVSALLLFAVQPMFTKIILPKLGGAPSVSSVAMVVFQTFLFIGYVYAHVIARTLTPARAAIVHLSFLTLVAVTLPLGIAKGFNVPPADGAHPLARRPVRRFDRRSVHRPFGYGAALTKLVRDVRSLTGSKSVRALRRF